MKIEINVVTFFTVLCLTTSFGWRGEDEKWVERGQLSVRFVNDASSDCYSDRDCYHHSCDHGHISYCDDSETCHCKRLSISTSFRLSGRGGEVGRRGQLSVRVAGDSHCHHDGECFHHDCDGEDISYCSHGSCKCKRCYYDYECDSHNCGNGEIQYCSSGRCHCRASTTINGTSADHIVCVDNSDCVHNSCPGEHMAPTCVETVFLSIFRSRVCICQALTISTAATTPTIVTTAPPTIHSTESSKSTATIPTIVPTREAPKSTSACHFHADCSGHLCQGNKHPYCKIDIHSSVCHCTVCTEDSHCYCPQGLVGKCHFNYFLRTYTCVCAISPETTSNISATTQTLTSSTTQATTTDLTGTQTTTGKPTNIVTTLTTMATGTPSTTQIVTTQAQTTGNPSTAQTTTITTTETPSTTAQTVTTQALTTLAKSTTANFTTTPSVTQSTSQLTGVTCPVCDENLNCSRDKYCFPGQVCMIGLAPIISHCSEPQDCSFIEKNLNNGEIFCCENRQCISKRLGI